ncbi:MAG: iron complex transport system permease protein [Enterobacterales bacterium]|jgi:iron complex transport system permease protein
MNSTSTTDNHLSSNNFALIIGLMFIILLASIIASISIGNVDMTLKQIMMALFNCHGDYSSNLDGINNSAIKNAAIAVCQDNSINQQIIWEIRLPRILMALLTGAGLSVTGAILQSVTRNPLADPYLFGISSGASLGAVCVMATISSASISITLGALIGSFFSVVLMLTLAGRAAVQVEKLLLAGVAVSFMLSAFTSLVLYYSDPDTVTSLLFWMMGSFSNSQWDELWMPTVTLTVGVALFFVYRRWLSAIQAGDESALTLGIPVNQLRLFMLIICAAITAVLVAHVGGIGFVGLMIPHISRFIVGVQIHRLLFMTLVLGASFMIWVDVIARTLLPNQVLPVGIVTSAVGSLFFFIILKYRSNSIEN